MPLPPLRVVPLLLWMGFIGCLTDPEREPPNTEPHWAPTGDLAEARAGHTALLLTTGRVLVVGGARAQRSALETAELYDPATGTFAPTGSLATARVEHTMTQLPDGRVLVTGGRDNAGTRLTSAELYDPATGHWSATGAMSGPRSQHTATLLPTGQVLLTGSAAPKLSDPPSGTAELYDPAAGTFRLTGSLGAGRMMHTATAMPNGQVLIAGGYGAENGHDMSSWRTAELYDPVTGIFRPTGAMAKARLSHAALLLPTGRVLVAGGWLESDTTAATEVYDPATDTWGRPGPLSTPRIFVPAVLLPSGQVFLSGGDVRSFPRGGGPMGRRNQAELYDPVTNTSTPIEPMAEGRSSHTATLLPDGRVLIVGGWLQNPGTASQRAQLYSPDPGT